MSLRPQERLAVYKGDVLTLRAPALDDLIRHTNHMVTNGFFGLDPQKAHSALSKADFRSRVMELRKAFNADTAIRHVVERLMKEWAADPDDAYFDALKLRIAPPGGAARGHPLAPLPAHRDTWGSNVMQQINVWAPLAPLARGRTLALWPEAFAQPVENDSADWDLDELRRRRDADGGAGFPLLPTATKPPGLSGAIRLLPKVGEAVVFSGAHLHASVPNRTRLARLNVEFRIVFLADRNVGRGALNVDGRAPRTPLHWFKSLDGRRSLADARPPLALV